MTKREAELAIKSVNRLYRALAKRNKTKYSSDYAYLKALITPYKLFKPSGNSDIAITARRLLKEFLDSPYTLEELVASGKNKEYVDMKFLLWYYLFYYHFYNYTEISRLFNKTHATVYYGVSRISDLYKYDKNLQKRIKTIDDKLNKNWNIDEKSNS